MLKIYSHIKPELLLHMVISPDDFTPGRVDAIDPKEFLQLALLNMNKGHTFKPHKHNWREGKQVIPQESWIVIRGKVQCFFYDVNDRLIAEPILSAGMISVSLHGGHNYLILEDNTIVAEYKVGPYFGQEIDKTFI